MCREFALLNSDLTFIPTWQTGPTFSVLSEFINDYLKKTHFCACLDSKATQLLVRKCEHEDTPIPHTNTHTHYTPFPSTPTHIHTHSLSPHTHLYVCTHFRRRIRYCNGCTLKRANTWTRSRLRKLAAPWLHSDEYKHVNLMKRLNSPPLNKNLSSK